MVWQKIDDQFGVSKKVSRIPRKRRQQCVGLWLLALNASGRYSSNGVLESADLDEIDAKSADVDELVRVDLWHRAGHSCPRCVDPSDGGIAIHDFLEYNPDAESVAAGKESRSEGGKHGNHVRWHVKRRLIIAGCEWCESGNDRYAIGEASPLDPPSPVPSPSPKTDVTNPVSVLPEVDAGDGMTDEEIQSELQAAGIRDLDRVRTALERVVGPAPHLAMLIDLVRAITRLATGHVKTVEPYIEATCVNSPSEVKRAWSVVTADWSAAVEARKAVLA
jgi:hypothetical protein